MKYFKTFQDIESSKLAILYSPTVINVTDGNNFRDIYGAVEKDDTLLRVHEEEELLKDLYIIEALPKRKIHFIIDDETEIVIEDNKLPDELPVPQAPSRKLFRGWYYDDEFIEPAHGGDIITEDTSLFAKFVSDTLTFHLKDASSANFITIDSIQKIIINGTSYEDDLNDHYDAQTLLFTFVNPVDTETITYSVYAKETYQDIIDAEQMYDSLNGNAITLIPGSTTLGDITAILNWNEGEDVGNIFDVYTLGYRGAAPDPDDADITDKIKILELSYNQHGTSYTINDTTTSQKDFDIVYTTFDGDWSRGEYTTISMGDANMFIEDLLRKYSFVFIVNDYAGAAPDTNNPQSSFGQDAPNMAFTLKFGSYEYTLNLSLPTGQQTESGDNCGNWIAFKTRLLGQGEIMTKVEDVITVYKLNGKSYLDGRNNAKTKNYDLTNGGKGVIN